MRTSCTLMGWHIWVGLMLFRFHSHSGRSKAIPVEEEGSEEHGEPLERVVAVLCQWQG